MKYLSNNSLKIIIILTLFLFQFSLLSCAVYAQDNPKVLFDETGPYGKYYTIFNTGPYGASSFATLLQENGYSISRLTDSPITYEKIKDYNVLILMAPGRNYTNSEINAIQEYVKNGGGLLLLGDVWGVEDGDGNYAFNKITKSFGASYAYNQEVVDPQKSMVFPYNIKVTDIKNHPITSNVGEFYFLRGTYLENSGNSSVVAYSDATSWADQLTLTSQGRSQNNEKLDPNEKTGPLPLVAAMEEGKGKVIFMSVGTFVNAYLYKSNGWKLGLNSVNWLSNQPISSNYKTAGLISLSLGDLAYKLLATILVGIIILILLLLKIRKDRKTESEHIIKTIKNWKYNLLIILNGIFIVLGAILFIPINIYLFDLTIPDAYDPYLGYTLLTTGILFIIISAIILFNIIVRLRLNKNFNYYVISLLLFFTIITVLLGDTFSFPLMALFSMGSMILLIPFLVNLWIIRRYGMDLIIEGKEFNRLEKLSVNSLPYELHAAYKNPVYVGEGGFGRVFKATRKDGLDVAIKIPKSFDKRSEKTFITEVSNWSQLDHPNIVRLYDFKILPIPYIEMEFCEGSLQHEQKPLNEAINIIYESAKGLSYAHSKNIIHGDIKTSNIMSHNGIYKVSDWGLSKMTTGESVTLSGATPQYAAPEQISHQFGKADERTDIYQLGTVFYELVTGELPFEGDMAVVYGSILNTEPKPPSEVNPKAILVEPIIMKCMNKDKDERYNSMEELLQELESYRESGDETILFKKE